MWGLKYDWLRGTPEILHRLGPEELLEQPVLNLARFGGALMETVYWNHLLVMQSCVYDHPEQSW